MSVDVREDDAAQSRSAQPRLFGRWGFWMVMVGAVSITSGLAFGYDQGVIGGPIMMGSIDPSATFAILAMMTVITLRWTWVHVPETRERSLEEIAETFERDSADTAGA